jgi:glutamyl-tRNA reductase
VLEKIARPEAVVLSTCNRVEIYAASEDRAATSESLAKFLAEEHDLGPEMLEKFLYRRHGAEAVEHLFRVAAGLDAMVVGETQILRQVKDAYETAREGGRTGRMLNPLFQRALHAAKRVHSETAISARQVSVPSVAAQLAGKIFRDLSEKTLLILGAGETGGLTVRAFRDRGLQSVLVVSRTMESAQKVAAEFGGKPHELAELELLLPKADVVISCLSAPEYVLEKPALAAALKARRGAPVFLIDIAVPRNVQPSVADLNNVYLFNIDDLEAIVSRNVVERSREIRRCDPIIQAETRSFMDEIATVDVADVLTDLRKHVQTLGDEELQRTLQRLKSLPDDQKEEVRGLVHRILGKVLHNPTAALKDEAADGRGHVIKELARRLFGIR